MNTTSSRYGTIPPEAVAARRGDEELYVLDVRNADDYAEWHIEGSHNLPIYDQLLEEDYTDLQASLDELPTDRDIVVVCVGGITSARAAGFLRERGYDATSMADGMRGWGRVHESYEVDACDGVTQVLRPGTGCVSYLVHDAGDGVVVDPSLYVDVYLRVADDRGVDIVGVVDTHAHADHVSGAPNLAGELDVPYYLHPADAGELDDFAPLPNGDHISVGAQALGVLHTPGHTPGSVSLEFGRAHLTGDTLFVRGVGRPDLEGSDEADVRAAASDLFDSLRYLASLPAETVVLPGHFGEEDLRPLAATLGDLAAENELFGMDDRDGFVDAIVDGLSEKPANYSRIKAINRGEEPLTADAGDLELGPNNCAAN